MLLCLVLIFGSAKAQSDYICLRYAVYMESRNQPSRTQRAVVDVIKARVRKTGLGVCKVLRIKGQFPWARKGFNKHKLDRKFIKEYTAVLAMEPVLSEDYLFFNQTRLPWGTDHRRIGDLIFNK